MGKIDPDSLDTHEVVVDGDIGRGMQEISPEDVDLTGWTPYEVNGQRDFPVYGASGSLCNLIWNAWYKKKDGKTIFISFERPNV